MTVIKTHLRTTETDHHGNIKLHCDRSPHAFSGVFKLGLIMGSQDDKTKRLPVDNEELPRLNDALNNVTADCLYGLAGIGALIEVVADKSQLSSAEYYGIGLVIKNLAIMAQEIKSYQENIAIDLRARNKDKTFSEAVDAVIAGMTTDMSNEQISSTAKACQAEGGLS
jgi:hypothetical protein